MIKILLVISLINILVRVLTIKENLQEALSGSIAIIITVLFDLILQATINYEKDRQI